MSLRDRLERKRRPERTITLDEGAITFVPAGDRGDGVAGFVLRGADGADPIETTIAGCRFRTA